MGSKLKGGLLVAYSQAHQGNVIFTRTGKGLIVYISDTKLILVDEEDGEAVTTLVLGEVTDTNEGFNSVRHTGHFYESISFIILNQNQEEK